MYKLQKIFSKDEILKLCPVDDCGKVLFPKYDLNIENQENLLMILKIENQICGDIKNFYQ